MKYCYLTKSQIQKLKTELMQKRSHSYSSNQRRRNRANELSSSSSFSQMYLQMRNTERGPIFEENVRKTLTVELKWSDVLIDRKIFYRKITIGNKTIMVKKNGMIFIKLNGKKIRIVLYNNGILCFYKNYIRKTFIGRVKNCETFVYIDKVKMKISRMMEGEIDGLMKINKNSFKQLINSSDINVIFNNINEYNSSKAQYVCFEIKMNKKKILDMIKQLKRDKGIVENIMRCKNTIYLGFVGSGKIDNSIKEKLCNLKDINVAIIEIKKYIWFGRNLVYYMDWTTIEMIKEIYEKIKKN